MDHLAIMKKEWKLTEKIISGVKTSEARWYKNKVSPWNKVSVGDMLYFKDSGSPITIKAKVTQVEQFIIKSNKEALDIMEKRAFSDLGTDIIPKSIIDYISNKKYAIFVHFQNAEKIKPFFIDKKGYGM